MFGQAVEQEPEPTVGGRALRSSVQPQPLLPAGFALHVGRLMPGWTHVQVCALVTIMKWRLKIVSKRGLLYSWFLKADGPNRTEVALVLPLPVLAASAHGRWGHRHSRE